MEANWSCIFFAIFIVISAVNSNIGTTASKILVLAHGFPSQLFLVHEVGEELSRRGNDVFTLLGSHLKQNPNVQPRGLGVLWYQTPEGAEMYASEQMRSLLGNIILSGQPQRQHLAFSKIALSECYNLERDKEAMQIISDMAFDIAIVGIFPLSYCFTFLPMKLKIPFVIVTPTLEADVFRSPLLPSFVPQTFAERSDDMTFIERLMNTFDYFYYYNHDFCPFASLADTTLVRKYRANPGVKSWNDAARLASLVLYTRGHLAEWPFPVLPHVVPIEGLSAKPADPLPQYLLNRLEALHTDVVVVTFSSMVILLPDAVLEKFLDAFGRRKETFVMSMTGRDSLTIPANVMIMDWLPQNDVLGYDKVRLFITHGGNAGFYEAMYHGVPVLTVPMFAEQHHNAYRNKHKGLGLSIDVATFTTEDLEQKIAQMITNSSFRDNAQRMSRLLRSRPMNGRETAAFWVEHVIQFGDSHLRSRAVDLSPYALYMVDILVFVGVMFLVTVATLMYACYWITQRIQRKSTKRNKYKTK